MIALSQVPQIPYAPIIRKLWREGLDTVAIAERLSIKEHVVANALAVLRDREGSR